MAKPIFIVKVPVHTDPEHISEIIRSLDGHPINQDYFMLIVMGDKKYPEFECFYEKDFDEIKYEELKELIKKSFKTIEG